MFLSHASHSAEVLRKVQLQTNRFWCQVVHHHYTGRVPASSQVMRWCFPCSSWRRFHCECPCSIIFPTHNMIHNIWHRALYVTCYCSSHRLYGAFGSAAGAAGSRLSIHANKCVCVEAAALRLQHLLTLALSLSCYLIMIPKISTF